MPGSQHDGGSDLVVPGLLVRIEGGQDVPDGKAQEHDVDDLADQADPGLVHRDRAPGGRVDDTQYRIVSALEAETATPRDDPDPDGYRRDFRSPFFGGTDGQVYRVLPQPPNQGLFNQNPNVRGLFGGGNTSRLPDRQLQEQQPRPRRFDPDYFWNNRMN